MSSTMLSMRKSSIPVKVLHTIPRQRKFPKRLDDGANLHVYMTPKDRFSCWRNERRFNQEDIGVINSLESFLIDTANDNSTSMPDNLETYLKDTGFDIERLKVQVPMLPSVIKTSSEAIKRVTSVRTIAGAMAESDIYKGLLPEINKPLELYLAFPVTTATAEHSFSSLRRVKTYLRNTMTSCRLNNLFLLYIHQDKTDNLDLYKIAKDFISVNNRRRKYFGNF